MESNAECLRLWLAALVIVTSLLTACATVSSEPVVGVCPPVVEYGAGGSGARGKGSAGVAGGGGGCGNAT